jgi:hypothetical protein
MALPGLPSSGMKSVGEVMSIGRRFEEKIKKVIRGIDDQLAFILAWRGPAWPIIICVI